MKILILKPQPANERNQEEKRIKRIAADGT